MIVTEAVTEYLKNLHRDVDTVLDRMQQHARRDGIPVVVPETGAFLETITRAVAAQHAVEVGTAIGVSTLHIARGGAKVVSFEVDDQRHQAAVSYLEDAGLSDRVDLRLKDASVGLKELTGVFDLAFVDGPKNLYSDHIDQVALLLRPGGLLLVDNALMSGGVAHGAKTSNWSDDQLEAMRLLHRRIMSDDSFAATVVPIGDGLIVAVVRS